MASSFIKFKGNGFWIKDPILEHALAWINDCFKREELPQKHTWIQELYDHYTVLIQGFNSSFMNLRFDEYLTNEERLQLMRDVLSRTIDRLHEFPELITPEMTREIYRFGDLDLNEFSPIEKTRIIQTIEYLLKLLSGEIRTKANDPITVLF